MVRRVGEACFPQWWRKLGDWRSARAERLEWKKRIADVLACPDNARLSRVANAGQIVDGCQIMHNGLKVVVNGYYGDGITRMLVANRGSHEPQEEVIFDAIVRSFPAGAVMVEAGAYWGFYSLWFCQALNDARVFLIEPDAENLATGQSNFQLNGCRGDFTRAYIGKGPGTYADGTAVVGIESYLAEKRLAHVHLLHADIQGAEVEMLAGARHVLAARSVDYLFISTHNLNLHQQCAEMLREHGYRVLASVDTEESHSLDGVLVACSPELNPPAFAPPSRKTKPGRVL